jgi:hypothetical protein
VENACPERIGTLNIRVKKIVLENYQESKSHVDFVNFFLSNARALESLELGVRNTITKKWIARQHSLLSIKSASRDAQVTFVPYKDIIKSISRGAWVRSGEYGASRDLLYAKHVHDLSNDHFQRFHY